ncbi:MAG: L-serine ammonia-lyase [Gammaproteobacteria bacterium]|nr:L-serine ammonia-lyase [Gammaproteobacteria bacterium]
MFISVLELFKIGIGPSSSHTLGPMLAARQFVEQLLQPAQHSLLSADVFIRCTLKGSLAFTGKGHSTDRAIALGLHSYSPEQLATMNVNQLLDQIWASDCIHLGNGDFVSFIPTEHIIFDKGDALPEHPNGMIFDVVSKQGDVLFSETYFSIGGGFISTVDDISRLEAPLKMSEPISCTYPFSTANEMMHMASKSKQSIAQMKRANELGSLAEKDLNQGIDDIWTSMQTCLENGLKIEGTLPGGLDIKRRAKHLYDQLRSNESTANVNDWLCAYAMAVNEENAAGNMVVTAPTNGAAGVIPAVLYYFVHHEKGTAEKVRDFLLTAAAIGGLIKHNSSISGAEVGCQGEVGSAAAMAAAGLCAVRGGSVEQVEKAAEIALEHHLGMTCDPVNGLVQVPCIERNGFGAIKAFTAASLALRESGDHFMPLDNCIAAMKQTGLEMSLKYKETSLGGLAVSFTEC